MDFATIATDFGNAETFLKAIAVLFGEAPKTIQSFFALSSASS